MFNKRKRIFISLLMLIAILSSLIPITPSQEVSAAVIGNDGVLPGGGTLGKGGGMCSATIYRIGISTEALIGDDSFKDTDDNDSISDKLENHFGKRFPNLQNSIMFVPDACYVAENAAIGWYNASTGDLVVNKKNITNVPAEEITARALNHAARVRNLKPTGSNPASNGVFYPRLLTASPATMPGDFSGLQGGKWKPIATSVPSYGTLSKQIWDYILGDSNQITNRLKTYIGEDLMDSLRSDEDHHMGALKYLDAMITLYMLSPVGDEREFYNNAIEKFLDRRDVDKYPTLFAIDTAVRFSSPAQLGGTYVYIPSSHYVNYMHGATPKTNITSPQFDPDISTPITTKKIIEASARMSMAELSNRSRKTDLPEDTDGFSWGYSGVVGDALRTNTTNQTATWRISSNVGIMESIFFNGSDHFGFLIAGGPHNKPIDIIDYKCECSQSVSIQKKDIEGQLKDGNIVGKKLPVLINMKQTDDEKLEDWRKMLDGATDLQIKVRLWRSQAPGTPVWGPAGAKPVPIDGNNAGAEGHWDNITKDQLLRYLADGETMVYEDDLSAYSIPDDLNQEFRYNASISIQGKTKQGKDFYVGCTADDTLSMFVKGPTPPEPERGHYSSSPEFWSEIKQGSPGNETFEAMTGTPTTRNLYFASGGSEFIVDVDVEYVPDKTSTRTYRSYYTGGVPSEFKLGDQAPNYTVPSPSGASSSSLTVNAHQGGTVTATWSGTTPYTGNLSWSDHSRSGADAWNDGPYNTAKAQAQAWASAVNGFVISHTAASDGITRNFNSWGASIGSDSNSHPAGYVNIGQSYIAPTPCSGNPCTGGSPGRPYIATTGAQGTAGSYTITVTGTLPYRIIDGPSSTYDLPPLEDTWTQEINYDYTKITNVKVWKIDRSKINGLIAFTPTNEVTASITQGDPTIFSNIADESRLTTEASAQGRLRYSLETNQHDVVVWNEGPRTNKDDGRGNNGRISGPGQTASWATGSIYTNNSYSAAPNYHVSSSTGDDKASTEWKKFDERRKTETDVTAISDFLILQTSSGDQSVMYFEKTSPRIASQSKIDVPKTSFDEQWTNNPTSAAKWEKDHINIGSYNGNYQTPNSKYSASGSIRVATKFDTMPAGLNRTARPSAPLRLVQTGIDVIDTTPNKEYITGTSDIFYRIISNYGTKAPSYSVGANAKYSANGVQFATTYSDLHSKVNDIVIHNPVSVEDAIVIPLPDIRDQRTLATRMIGGNLQQPTVRYEKRLKPGYVFTPTAPVYDTQTVPNPNYVPPSPGLNTTFQYTGSVQSIVIPSTGSYVIEAYGAEGGANSSGLGGAGGYAGGYVDLVKDQVLYIYVGGKGEDRTGSIDQYDGLNNNGGWNGGGSGSGNAGPGGGGASDIRTGAGTNTRILVAGGGGAGNHSYNFGGNTTNLTSSPQGANGCTGWTSGNTYEFDNGGGGGGYLGGQGSCSDDGRMGYGGSSYTGTLYGTTVNNGVHRGHGVVAITSPSIAGQGNPTIEVQVLVSPGQTEPPEDAYEYIEIISNPAAPVETPLGTYTPGRFINLDYPFQISFPNVGDFYGDGASGVRFTSGTPGKGYTDDMSTTEWTASKQVRFQFFVTYNGRTYAPNTWIDLTVSQTTFDFYLPLANSEAISALVEFRAIANNAPYFDGAATKNKARYGNLAAEHGAIKGWDIDIVGRIGALVLEDTGDFRFSNLFKQPSTPAKWLIPNVVREVNNNAQNFIVGDNVDIRGESLAASRGYLDTYGLLPHLRQSPITLPLTPDKNNIPSLRKQPMRLGYMTLADVQTIGNYYSRMQITPYYYGLNLNTGAITPIDIYMSVSNNLQPINKFGAAVPGWDTTSVYKYIHSLDWDAESGRRNYSEMTQTNNVVEDSELEDNLGNITNLGKPFGNKYPFGTAQIMYLNERNRTFIGTDQTNGVDRNPGDVINYLDFGKQGQRWHFTYGLPSSSVGVPQGQPVTQSNVEAIKNNYSVILVALDIKSVGTTYALQYSKANGSVTIGGRTWSLSSIPHPVVSVYSADKSSADDLTNSGTH